MKTANPFVKTTVIAWWEAKDMFSETTGILHFLPSVVIQCLDKENQTLEPDSGILKPPQGF